MELKFNNLWYYNPWLTVEVIVYNFINVESILGVGFSSKHNHQSYTHLFDLKIAIYPTCD
jgi:hypothetical protein